MAGLDPAILARTEGDARIKSGHDDVEWVTTWGGWQSGMGGDVGWLTK